MDETLDRDARTGKFGGIPYEGLKGLSFEEQRDYLKAMNRYVAAQRNHPAYERQDGNDARQALQVERDLRALIHGRVFALAPKPEAVKQVQSLAYTVKHLSSPEQALAMAVNRAVSRSLRTALESAPAIAPLAVAALVAKDVLGFVNDLSLSEQEHAQRLEAESRHDREQQFMQVNEHEYERSR